MSQTTMYIVAAIVVMVLLLLLFLLRGRKQHVTFDATAPLPRTGATSIPAAAPQPVAPPALLPEEGHGIGSEVAAAIEDVVDQFVGTDAHPSGRREPAGDQLTLLKGLGPRAATRFQELGVTSFAQIAAWDDTDVAAIDAQMGAFKGRIVRDRWVEQARLLAKGDEAAFEEQFGKLGG